MSVATIDATATATTTVLETERAIRWYLDRRASAKPMSLSWTNEAYRQAVDQSLLKPPVRKTLHAMLVSSVGGVTTIDRASLCRLTGLKDVKTITTHFSKARAAGLLESVRRMENSSIHTLLIPGIDASTEDKQQGGQLANWHSWTVDEIAWWDDLDPEGWTPPPWHPWKGYEPQF